MTLRNYLVLSYLSFGSETEYRPDAWQLLRGNEPAHPVPSRESRTLTLDHNISLFNVIETKDRHGEGHHTHDCALTTLKIGEQTA